MNANHVKRNLPYIIMAKPAVSIFAVFFIIPLIVKVFTVLYYGLSVIFFFPFSRSVPDVSAYHLP